MERARRLRIHSKTTVFAVVAAQIVAGVVLAGIFEFGGNSEAAYSVLTGTLSGALPNFYLAQKMFSVAEDAPAERMLRAVYLGETLKILFAGSLLAVAMVALEVSVPFLLVGYLATVMVQWFALLMPARGELP